MEKRKAKIINFILYSLAFLIFLCIFIDYSFIKEIPNCQTSFRNFNITNSSFLLKVNGSSMFPSIKSDSECICSRKDNYTLGDIVVFSFITGNQKLTVMHRIIKINSTDIITAGDSNNFTDSFLVPQKAIICAVENKHRINL